jgi:hypothetical protein
VPGNAGVHRLRKVILLKAETRRSIAAGLVLFCLDTKKDQKKSRQKKASTLQAILPARFSVRPLPAFNIFVGNSFFSNTMAFRSPNLTRPSHHPHVIFNLPASNQTKEFYFYCNYMFKQVNLNFKTKIMEYKLFTPAKVGGIEVKNRIVMSPMTRCRAIGNVPNDLVATYYGQRAGAGLIVT